MFLRREPVEVGAHSDDCDRVLTEFREGPQYFLAPITVALRPQFLELVEDQDGWFVGDRRRNSSVPGCRVSTRQPSNRGSSPAILGASPARSNDDLPDPEAPITMN